MPQKTQADESSQKPEPHCDAALVQMAFALGWHVAELYHFDKVGVDGGTRVEGVEGTPPRGAQPRIVDDVLPGIGSLDPEQRRELLVRQVRHDIPPVWSDTPGGLSAAELDARIQGAAAATDVASFRAQVRQVHEALLSGLTVADFRLGKSYGIARALAESTIIPCFAAAGRGLAEDPPTGDHADAFHAALLTAFDGGRIFTIQAWLHDMRDCFPAYAADAVATTLGGWGLWIVRPTIGKRQPVAWKNQHARERVERALRRQGDVWRGLLSGEKDPVNMLGADYYFAAMASLVRRISGLAAQFLGTGIGLLLFLILMVAAIALYLSETARSTTGVLASVVTLLGSLGITAGSAWATVKKTLSQAEAPLWHAEVSAAVAHAAWKNPAPLGSIEAIQLLLAVGQRPDPESETRARHPGLTALRNLPAGRLGVILIVASTAIGVFAADAGRIQRDAAYFVPAFSIVAFLALIDGWDLLIGLAARQAAPFLALPERIELPPWLSPLAQVLAPLLLITGLLAGHFFWH